MKFYVDTSVWRDYFEDRGNGIRPLGEFAFRFLRKCQKDKATIIVSDIVIEELRRGLSEEQIEGMLSEFSELIVRVEHTEMQAEEARVFCRKHNYFFPFADALHSIIARDEDATVITRDKHFESIGIAEALAPEETL